MFFVFLTCGKWTPDEVGETESGKNVKVEVIYVSRWNRCLGERQKFVESRFQL